MKIFASKHKGQNSIKIIIDFYYNIIDEITASFNPGLSDSDLDNIIEEDADDTYRDFINTVVVNIKNLGYEILEYPQFSNNVGSKSCYITICNKDDYDALKVEMIFNLRISDHRLHKHKSGSSKSRFEYRDDYYEKELNNNYRILNEENPEFVKQGLFEIFISGNKFKTYRDALNYILNKIKHECI